MSAATNFNWGFTGKSYSDPSQAQTAEVLGPATTIVALPVDGTPFPPPRAIQTDVAGTGTITDAGGNVLTGYPLTGQEQHIAIQAISALVTTAKVWGLY